MKQFIFLVVVVVFFIIPVTAQTKRTPKTTPTPKPQSQKVEEVTTQEATTSDGKKVILKSNKTWDYVEEKPTTKKEPSQEVNNLSDYSKVTLEIPIDTSITKFPLYFPGHDFDLLHEILSGKKSFKSEFETTDEYLNKVTNKKALDKDSQFAIFIDRSALNYELSYNADTRQFNVLLKFEDKAFFAYQPYKFIINFRLIFVRGVMGTFGIVVKNPEKLGEPFVFNVEAQKAKEIKENASVLVLFQLKPPYFYDRSDREISNPAVLRQLIVGEINDLWLVNKETGEIYAKLIK